MSYTASVIGGRGFTGGELLRLLDGHPEFELVQATSRSKTNKTVGHSHPNLRHLDLRFSSPEDLESVDVLFAATPHGVSMDKIDEFQEVADTVVDLSADFRLSTEAQYEEYYDGHDLGRFPSLHGSTVRGVLRWPRPARTPRKIGVRTARGDP